MPVNVINSTIKTSDLTRYAALAFPMAFCGLPLYVHAPDHYAASVGLSLSVIGSILLAARLFDAVQDPLIGYLSDKYAHCRKAIILWSCVLLGAGFSLLFHPLPDLPAVSFAAGIVVATTAFSVIVININALGSLWSADPAQKTRITAAREGVGLAGLLLATILPPALAATGIAAPLTIFTAVFIGALSLAAIWFARWYGRWSPSFPASDQHALHDWRSLWRVALGRASYRRFFLIYGLSILASSIPAVLVLFFIRDRLDAEPYAGAFLFLYFMAGIAALPLWRRIAAVKGNNTAWFYAMILSIAAFIWAFFLGEGDIAAYAVICVLSGTAVGAELALPPSILSGLIDEEGDAAFTSTIFSFLAFLGKAALALATGVSFFILDAAGFRAAEDNTSAALFALSATYAALPCLLKLIPCCLLFERKSS